MAIWNHTDRALQMKIVYYGPGLGGKTTNLQQVHRIIDPGHDTRLISLNTAGDRTLFFDLLPFDLGRLFGYSIKAQIYTVPGQVRYNATRKVVLAGADGVVFVADSAPEKGRENRGAWENLKANLRACGLDPERLPVILQCNKQDLPEARGPEEVAAEIGAGIAGIGAAALQGRGVMETFQAALQATVRRLAELARRGVDPDAIAQHVARTLSAFVTAPGSRTPGPEPQAIAAEAAGEPPGPLSPDDLLRHSVGASLSMAADYSEMREIKNRLAARVRELEALHASVRKLNSTRDVARILEGLAATAKEVPGGGGVSVLVDVSEDGPLQERVLVGLESDPANGVSLDGEVLARRLLRQEEARLAGDVAADRPGASPPLAGVGSLIAVPVLPVHHPALLLIAYCDAGSAGTLGQEELRFLSLLGMQAATALDNAVLYRKMASYSERLESDVLRRTAELRHAYEKLKELDRMKDRFLSSVSHEMNTPLTGILTATDLLDSMTAEGDERKEFLAIVREQGRRLGALVDEVIQLWVLRQGGARLVTGAVSMADLTRKVVEEARAGALARGVQIRHEVLTPRTGLTGDSYLLRLALRHVVNNAVKFSPDGATVRVSVGAEPRGMLCVSVQDEGPGIPPAERERVMERFEQAGDILTAKPSGLGLGLPLVREILQRHSGSIALDRAPAGGTIARVLLPFPGSAEESATCEERGERAPQPAGCLME